ncbi:acyl-homoserine-lactone synthase [Bradyrhizobium sp. AUGA SZCCT0431]|uniref:acyl-homoserine-lactone synthase n=1 Tax=Bradyrhizobium sp. AUGA SZCCT0431 TaxID=2807674 RepID=UPI001BAE12E5|nr:acyl-homoserine-lactone synthase [Bradyrhizobium sp. AUGA SZCCT0431]MBR1146152.1 conjugal transfer protein TraI [Bradyrhizobium sp. AUGA SZCCT0431]
MIQLIVQQSYGQSAPALAEMHRLRHRVFRNRLDWDVTVSGDMEVDEFDALNPAYLLQRGDDGRIQGCARLLPTTGPTMLRDTFPVLLAGQPAPSSNQVWESSRFAIDVAPGAPKGEHGIACATYELLAGVIEFGLSRELSEIVTVTDARMERILRRTGWMLQRVGKPAKLGNTLAVAGYLQVSMQILTAVRNAGGLSEPVLWAPVMLAAA